MNGVSIKTRVVDNESLVDTFIAEFNSKLGRQLVGLDVKISSTKSTVALLLLYAGSHCLIIQMNYSFSKPGSLKQFLDNQNICFVGVGMNERVSHLKKWYGSYSYPTGNALEVRTGVELGDLAARILKKPKLVGRGLAELGSEVGFDIGSESSSGSSNSTNCNWGAKVFSHEEVKYAMTEVYAAYQIGNKLVDKTWC